MHPASGLLFFQGALAAELKGRIQRLRHEAKDLSADRFQHGTEQLARSLSDKYALDNVGFESPGRFATANDEPAEEGSSGTIWQLPFRGSGVILQRCPAVAPGPHPPGTVVERTVVADGRRCRVGWIEVPVPDGLSEDDRTEWRNLRMAELEQWIKAADSELDGFRQTLYETAVEAVATRRDKLVEKGQL